MSLALPVGQPSQPSPTVAAVAAASPGSTVAAAAADASNPPSAANTPASSSSAGDLLVMDPTPAAPPKPIAPAVAARSAPAMPAAGAGRPGPVVGAGGAQRAPMTVGVKREPPDDAAAGPSLSAGPPNPGGAGARIKQPAPLIAPAAPEINRHRKQAFVDSEWLKRRMAETATQRYGLHVGPSAADFLGAHLEARCRSLLERLVAAKRHRLESSSAYPAPSYKPEEGGGPMWSLEVVNDPGKVLTAVERVDREEEGRRRRERMRRDEEARMRAREEEAERERRERMGEQPLEEGSGGASTPAGADGAEPMDGVQDDEPASSPPAGGAERPPAKKKAKKDGSATPSVSTPGGPPSGTPSTAAKVKKPLGPSSAARNMSEQAQKRVSNSVALQSAGIARKSWMFPGGAGGMAVGSPSPAPRVGSSASRVKGEPSTGGSPSDAPATPVGTGAAASSTPASSGWAKPFLSSTTSTPLLPPSAHALNGSPLGLTPGDVFPPGSHGAQAYDDGLPADQPIALRDALWVLERERKQEAGEGRGGVGRVLRRARADWVNRGWD